MKIDGGPPVLVPSEPLIADAPPVAQDLRPATVAVVERLFPVAEPGDVPLPADRGVQELVGPVVILDRGHQGVAGLDAKLPFVTLVGLGRQALLD